MGWHVPTLKTHIETFKTTLNKVLSLLLLKECSMNVALQSCNIIGLMIDSLKKI